MVVQPRDPGRTGRNEVEMDYRTLVEQIPAITYVEVHDGSTPTGQRTTYVSPQAATILGDGPNEFVHDPQLWRTLRHPADRATVMAAERTAEVTRQPFHAVYRMFDRSGRLHWFRDDAVIVEHDGGTFWQGVMIDITAQKETETDLQDALEREHALSGRPQELKNTLLHTLSHDLKDPLTAVHGAYPICSTWSGSVTGSSSPARMPSTWAGSSARSSARPSTRGARSTSTSSRSWCPRTHRSSSAWWRTS